MIVNIITIIIITLIAVGWLKQSYEEGLFRKLSSVIAITIALFGSFELVNRLPAFSKFGEEGAYLLVFFLLASGLRFILDLAVSWTGFVKFIPVIGSIYKLGGSFIGFIEFCFIVLYITQLIFMSEAGPEFLVTLKNNQVLSAIQSVNPLSYVY